MSKFFFYLFATTCFTLLTVLVFIKTNKTKLSLVPINLSYSNSSFDTQGNNLEQELLKLPKSQLNQVNILPSYTFTRITSNPKINLRPYLKLDNNNYYGAPGGRGELNQNIRELCAFSQKTDNHSWLSFLNNYNRNCLQTLDEHCWEDQAESSNLNVQLINQCFNSKASIIVSQEIKKPLLLSPQINGKDIDIPNLYATLSKFYGN